MEDGETWKILEAKATKVFKKKLEIDQDVMIERAHRMKSDYKEIDFSRYFILAIILAARQRN